MIEVIPAIMPDDIAAIRQRVKPVLGMVSTVQLDVMDGVFVPEKTWPYVDDESFTALQNEDEGLPYWQEVNYEVDLMVSEPEHVIGDWINAGVARVIVHIESTDDIEQIIRQVQSHSVGDSSMGLSLEFGLALNPDTDSSTIENYIEDIDFIQCMGIDRIGYQGQPFNEDVLVKIRDLRKQYPGAIISVDGGVDFDTAPELIDAGANRLVSGSAVYTSENIQDAITTLRGDHS